MLISHDFLFVHVPKTGGTSVRAALVSKVDMATAGKHQHPLAKGIKKDIGEQTWNRIYKFAFVRNPWSRLVSWHNAMREHPPLPNHERARDELPDFAAFLKRGIDYGIPIWRNQVTWVMENDAVIVDFIGRYETLQRDFVSVCERIGITVELPHLNATRLVDYRDFYTPELRALVAEKYRGDIEVFGYQF